jgi:hypothetical protein
MNKLKIILFLFAAVAIASFSPAFAANIDPLNDDSQYAYGENVGWFNFEPGQGDGVTVEDTQVTGFVWQENIGWINLGPMPYGGVVNDGMGNLSGWAWGENVGWISFSCANTSTCAEVEYKVTIDGSGNFQGFAWGENIGWVALNSTSLPSSTIDFKVQTEWSHEERFVDNYNGTVTDTATGLIWLKNADAMSGRFYWSVARTYCSYLASGMAGLTDGSTAGQWRLPTKDELQGIGTNPPATWEVNTPSVYWTIPGLPFNNVVPGIYWSATSCNVSYGAVWFVDMNDGWTNFNDVETDTCYVWPVREPGPATERFIDNDNGTVIDSVTGLIWLKNANPCGLNTWYDAEAYCSSLASGQAGLTDGSVAGQWRLPSKAELEGLGTNPPATWDSGYPSAYWTVPDAPFINVQYSTYWTNLAYDTDYAWNVYMNHGYATNFYKGYYGCCVWPVREAVPTLIKLASFQAIPKAGKVILQWETETEVDNAGFNIYRAETEDGEYIKINEEIIASEGSATQGASYEFVDDAVQNGRTYFYKLEDLDTQGGSKMHGPVSATPRLLYRDRR